MLAKTKTLEQLARRVEEAEGPDREIDNAIVDAFGWRNDHGVPIPPGFIGLPAYTGSINDAIGLPAYTGSINDALTLVPEGWDWSISRCIGDGSFPPFACNMTPVEQPYRVDAEIDTEASTPALALCAAALRALSHKDGEV